MKRAKTHIILFMAVTITVLYTVYIAFHNSTERVNTQIDHAFKSAITEDYNERLAYISYYHVPAEKYGLLFGLGIVGIMFAMVVSIIAS